MTLDGIDKQCFSMLVKQQLGPKIEGTVRNLGLDEPINT